MGVVYKARQISLGPTVAVKMILAGNLATKADHDRFHCEAQAAALLDHPNILPVFEVGEQSGQHYFSMGYVDGPSLAAKLAEGPLPPGEAAELVATVAEAVEYAHRQGVIHRDIKPSNILLDKHSRPRVTDFGLAKRLDGDSQLTTTGQILGTPSYMAPEQAAGEITSVGPAADVYAFGALLYAALTGRPPFQAATPHQTMQQVLARDPVVLRQLNAAVPRDLETIALKCLEKAIPRRYATAQALADDVRRYLAGRPIEARPVGRWEHAWRWCRRQPVVAGLIAAVALSLVAGIVASSLFAAGSYREARCAQDNEQQSNVNLYRAEAAETAAQHDLAQALSAQARLASRSRKPGQRFETLAAIGKVRQIEGPSRKLADEAVAALCMADLVVDRQWPGAAGILHGGLCSPLGCLRPLRRGRQHQRPPRRGRRRNRCLQDWLSRRCIRRHGIQPGWAISRATTYNDPVGSRLFRVDVTPAVMILNDRHLALAFSPDSRKFIAQYPGNEYRLCELPSRKVLKRFTFPGADDELHRIYWNPRKPQIAIVRRGGWRLADLETGVQQAECSVPGRIGTVAWHPNGRYLAITTEDPPTKIDIFDTLTGRVVGGWTGMPTAGIVPTFNHAGDLLVTNDWLHVRRLWEPASGTELLHVPADDRNFFLIGLDDRHAAFNFEGQDLQTLRIAAGAERTFASTSGATSAAGMYGEPIEPSLDGRLLAIASSTGVALVDARSGFELATVPDVEPAGFDAAGALLTAGTGGVHRWSLERESQGQILRVKRPEALFDHAKIVSCFSVSRNGTVIALANAHSNIGAVVLRQPVPGGEVQQVVAGPQYDVRHVALSPDGNWVAAGCFLDARDKLTNAKVWDARSGELKKTLPVGSAVWVWFSPRGTWLATLSRSDGECRLWRTGYWEAGPRFLDATEIAFSSDEQILAVGSKAGRIRLYETATGQNFATLPATEGTEVCPRAFSPDGTRVYAKVQFDTRIHAWDLRQIRDGLRELGLDQGWPEFPPPQANDIEPPIIQLETAGSPP